MSLKRVRGTRDFFEPEVSKFREIERRARRVLLSYGYREVITPLIELKSLFERSLGEDTDIVEKEMFVFKTKSDEEISLRPEGTASVVRAYVESAMFRKVLFSRLFYIGPMFRYERPQRGRFRQFHQIGAELFGTDSPLSDAEIIKMATEILKGCEVSQFSVELNSVGCKKCRKEYSYKLKEFLLTKKDYLCDDCLRRIERAPLRTLDCKKESCVQVLTESPSILHHLCSSCSEHFEEVKKNLQLMGVDFRVNEKIVRGLDYYTRTTFEINSENLGSQNAIAAGGRYDGLVKELGGEDVPAIGFAIGMERLMEVSNITTNEERKGVAIIPLSVNFVPHALRIAEELRKDGVMVIMDYRLGTLKTQIKRADKEGVRFALIIGDEEVEKNVFSIKDLASGEQNTLPFEEVRRKIING